MSTNTVAAPAPGVMLFGLGTPLLIITLLAMMVLPLPALMLDILFTFKFRETAIRIILFCRFSYILKFVGTDILKNQGSFSKFL